MSETEPLRKFNERLHIAPLRTGASPIQRLLPDGKYVRIPTDQAKAVWEIWLGLAPVLAARGEGLALSLEGPDSGPGPSGPWPDLLEGEADILLMSLYPPRGERVMVYVNPKGCLSDQSERKAPAWVRGSLGPRA